MLSHASNILQGGYTLPIQLLALVTCTCGKQLLATGKYHETFELMKPWCLSDDVSTKMDIEQQERSQLASTPL